MSIRRIIGRAALAGAALVAVAGLCVSVAPVARAAPAAAECTPIPEFSDNMTAAVFNPTYIVTGTVNAAGCDVGVYFGPGRHGTVRHANIVGAADGAETPTAFGIVVDSATVTIEYSHVSQTFGRTGGCGGDDDTCEGGDEMTAVAVASAAGEAMEQEYIGDRHGTGILVVGARAHATVLGSSVSTYGRRGISVTGPGAWASITGNTITGVGADYPDHPMSQSGVWVANGARASIVGNTIENNLKLGHGPASNGVMVAGGANHNGQPNFTRGVEIISNRLVNNVIGVLLSNLGAGQTNPTTRTNNHVADNYIQAASGVTVTPAAEAEGEEDGGMPPAGVFVAGGRGDTITGNTFAGYATLAAAIKVSERARDFTVVEGNRLIG